MYVVRYQSSSCLLAPRAGALARWTSEASPTPQFPEARRHLLGLRWHPPQPQCTATYLHDDANGHNPMMHHVRDRDRLHYEKLSVWKSRRLTRLHK